MPDIAGPVVQPARTSAFQAGNAGSNPIGATTASSRVVGSGCRVRGLGGPVGFWPVSGILEPVLAVFGVAVGPVMGSGDADGWVRTRLVRRVSSVGGGWVGVGLWGCPGGCGIVRVVDLEGDHASRR